MNSTDYTANSLGPTDGSRGPSRRTIMAVAAWSAPAIVATAASPAAAASSQSRITLAFDTLPTVEEFSRVPSFALTIYENGVPISTGSHRVIVTLHDGLEWGEPGSGVGGAQTLTSLNGRLMLGGIGTPAAIASTEASEYPIIAQLESDPTVLVAGSIRVIARSTYTVTWASPTLLNGFTGEALAAATAVSATRDGTATAGIPVSIEPSAHVSWTSGAQGARDLVTGAKGEIDFAAGTFKPAADGLHTLTARATVAPEVRHTLEVFAVSRASATWVKDSYVRDGALAMVIDIGAFDGPNRMIIYVDGVRWDETYQGAAVHGATVERRGPNAVLSKTGPTVNGGEKIEVFLAPRTPGADDAGAVKIYTMTIAVPPADASGWVKSIESEDGRIVVVIEKSAFDSANRIQVRHDGVYVMETYGGSAFQTGVGHGIDGSTVRIESADVGARKGSVIEVYLAPGKPGLASGGRITVARRIIS